MSVRAKETRADQNRATVNRAVNTVVSQGNIVAMARGTGNIGTDGEIATNPIEPWPEIDPETGDFEEPVAAPLWFCAGDKAGVNPVHPGTYRGGE